MALEGHGNRCKVILGYLQRYELVLTALDIEESSIDPQRFLTPMKMVNRVVRLTQAKIFNVTAGNTVNTKKNPLETLPGGKTPF